MENRYDKYKDSGIAWIGEIPEHWEICKLKNIFSLSTGTTPKNFDKISEGENLINWYTPSDILDSCNDLFSSQRKLSEKVIYENKISLFPIGTLLYVGIGASAGKVGYANESGYSNQQITGLIPLECYSKFYFYYLSVLKDKIRDNAFFTTLPIINNAYLGQELIPYPHFSEQQFITTYLDQKCSEIDELITLQEEMITKLQSYKQSVITEAVTKGLDKNVPLKDSGIEWIGEIPEHWNIIKTKNAFKIISGATPKTDNITYWDGEIIWITPADYKTEDRIIKSGKRNITLAGLNSCGTSIIPENSIIFSKRAPIGLVAINIVPLCTNQGCISCIPKSFVSSKYFYYLMSVLTEWFELFGSGTTFKELSTNNFANFSLSQPPFSEQQSIADYLDQKCSEIDELITIKQQKIEKLKDYKKSLIFECVTGKRKVS